MPKNLAQTQRPPPRAGDTVRQLIRAHLPTLTRSERKAAAVILDDYPGAGLGSITAVAARAGVSSPTIARLVQKLGFKGFPSFHDALLGELKAKVSGPTERRANWAAEAPEGHLLNRFAEAVRQNFSQSLAHIDPESFDAAARRLARVEGRLYVVGGRITRAMAEYAFTHFQAIRKRVTHMTASSATWPHYVLDMEAGDTLLMFDVRRYEANLLRLAQIASERGVSVILITDQWASPVAGVADYTFNGWVEIPSAWDSNISTIMLVEALIAAAQEVRWPETQARYDALDALFDEAKLFRKP